MTRVEWSNVPQVQRNMAAYGDRVKEAERRVAQYWSAVIEADAKQSAPWTDRTANARQSLRAYLGDEVPSKFGAPDANEYPAPTDLARDVVSLYLSHGMEYGVQLETRFNGRYAVILPTLQKHYPAISRMLRGIFGR